MGLFTINRDLFWVKAHYFLYFGGAGSFWSFVTVFGKQLGVSEMGVGLIFTVAPITGLISMPLFGVIADRFDIKKHLFLLFNLLNAVAFLGFAFLPSVIPSRPIALDCQNGASYLTQCGQKYDICNGSLTHSFIKDQHPIGTNAECFIHCDMNQEDRLLFCKDFHGNNKPKFCLQDAPMELSAYLKIANTTLTQDCIFIPIDFLRYGGREENMQYSCPSKPIFSNSSCVASCPHNQKLNKHLEIISTIPNFSKTTIFWIYTFLVLSSWICMAVVTSVADCLCFETLGDKPHLYGKQRQWGAIGWGLATMVSGYLIDVRSQESVGIVKDYSSAFYLMGVLLLLNLIVCFKWDVVKREKTKTLGKDLAVLVCNPTIVVFIFSCVAVGMCTGLLWQFLFWYIEDLASTYHVSCEFSNLKYVKSLQGLISIVQCFGGELPFFYISGWFIRRLGHVHCMTLVLAAFALRFFLYSILANPWTVLPVELFQGLTYGIFYANMASYAYVVSPPGSGATVQGIVGAAFEGVGVGAGSLLGGVLYSVISGKTAFRVFAVGTLIAACLHGIVMYFIKKNSNSGQNKEYIAEDTAKSHELDEMLNPFDDAKTEEIPT